MQRGPWWQTGSVLAPSLRTEWCWGTDRSRAPMERPLVRGRPSSEDGSVYSGGNCGGLGGRRDSLQAMAEWLVFRAKALLVGGE